MIAVIAVFLLGSPLAAQVHSDAAGDRTMADARLRNEIYERKLFAERFNALTARRDLQTELAGLMAVLKQQCAP